MTSITIYKDFAVLFTLIRGREYSKTVAAGGSSREESELTLLLAALKCFNRPCDITIYSGPYVYGVLKNEWIDRWADNGWVNSKGNPVRYKEKWQQVHEKLKEHHYTAELKGERT